MNSSCPSCSLKFDLQSALPKILICGHTLCLSCCNKYKTSSGIYCSYDQQYSQIDPHALNNNLQIMENLQNQNKQLQLQSSSKLNLIETLKAQKIETLYYGSQNSILSQMSQQYKKETIANLDNYQASILERIQISRQQIMKRAKSFQVLNSQKYLSQIQFQERDLKQKDILILFQIQKSLELQRKQIIQKAKENLKKECNNEVLWSYLVNNMQIIIKNQEGEKIIQYEQPQSLQPSSYIYTFDDYVRDCASQGVKLDID